MSLVVEFIRRRRCSTSLLAIIVLTSTLIFYVDGFTINSNNINKKNCNTFSCTNNIKSSSQQIPSQQRSSKLYIFAPPGSGYVRSDVVDDDEIEPSTHPELQASDIEQISPSIYPKTYEPMLEYPGTMRPGRTPENMPYHDLPGLDIHDPDPVPWPHFQEIEWHHKWDPPHESALAMEEFIEVQGRWASVEEEAEMRMGMRRGVRERRENEESLAGGKGGAGSEQMVIMDDDEEEDDEGGTSNIGIGLGEGVEALLQSSTDTDEEIDDETDDQDDSDESDDDFLMELGLGDDADDEEEEEEEVDDDDFLQDLGLDLGEEDEE